MRAKAAAVTSLAIKALLIGTIGFLAVFFSLTFNGEGGADLMAMAMFPLGMVWLAIALVYFVACLVFAAAARFAAVRWIGAVLDAVLSLLIAAGIVWFGSVTSYANPGPLLIAIPIASLWLGASIPGLVVAVRGG